MKTLSNYPRIQGVLVGCTIFASCLVLSGCEYLKDWFCEDSDTHYPSTVLLVNKDKIDDSTKTTAYEINWDKIWIGNKKLEQVLHNPKNWRLTLYSYENPAKEMADSGWHNGGEAGKVEKLPLDYLMRADLSLIYEGTVDKPTKTASVSFVVLMHKFPENEPSTAK